MSRKFIRRASERITANVLDSEHWKDAKSVAAFVGYGGEPDTSGLIEAALNQGKTLWLPRVVDQDRMSFHRVEAGAFPEEFAENKWGILEPQDSWPQFSVPSDELDLILVPGVAFDRKGERLGQGGGYYDRFFDELSSNQRTNVVLVRLGICFDQFLLSEEQALPVEEHDFVVDLVISDEQVVYALDCL